MRKETEKNIYATGSYRLWYDKKTDTLRLKLDGEKDLYYIPKSSKMYNELMENKIMEGAKQ
jgi:hypothetical protein